MDGAHTTVKRHLNIRPSKCWAIETISLPVEFFNPSLLRTALR